MSNQGIARVIGVGLLLFSALIMASSGTFVVKPGYRGIEVTLGQVSPAFKPEGFGMKPPFVTEIVPISVRQQTAEELAECYSSDLQQIRVDLRLLYRIPENSVVKIFQDYDGDPFDSLIAPRVQEAIKEVTASLSAEQIVKSRGEIKKKALNLATQKIGSLLVVEDIVLRDIDLSPELGKAIEAKMVAEQQANQARFTQVQTQIEAETAVISARGEAEAIRVRGDALRLSPSFLRWKIVERWNGRSPMVIPPPSEHNAAGLLLPLSPAETPSTP